MLFEETEWTAEIDVDVEVEQPAAVRREAAPEPTRTTTREMPATLLTYLNDQVRASIVRERNERRRAQSVVVIEPPKG